MPSKYIDLMIRAGTITELDLYMLRCACVQLQTWKREGRGTLWLSCNFTRQSIAAKRSLRACTRSSSSTTLRATALWWS